MRKIHFLTLALTLLACGASRDAVLSRTLAGLNAAHEAFTVQLAQREAGFAAEALKVPAAATSLEEGRAALAAQRAALEAFRGKADKVSTAFVAAYAAVAVASLDPTDAAIGQVIMLASRVVEALRELGIMPGGTPS